MKLVFLLAVVISILVASQLQAYILPVKAADPTELVKKVPVELQPAEPAVLKAINAAGSDKEYVELTKDYGLRSEGKSPYSQTYSDRKGDYSFLVVSQLPMVDAEGDKLRAGWFLSDGKYYTNSGDKTYNNLFSGEVSGTQVKLTITNDQPYGIKSGDEVVYNPQLFVGGNEIRGPPAPTLLPVDPMNENYQYNVLVWDYGVCVRQIRIIEGMYRETWIFNQAPKGDVLIKHNQIGDFTLSLGQFAIDSDTELVPAKYFLNPMSGYPVVISASLTVYPDAHVETATVDGYVTHVQDNTLWSTIRGGVGTGADDGATSARVIQFQSGSVQLWHTIRRGIQLFDISGAAGGTITAVTESFYGVSKVDQHSATPNINVYASAPASNTQLVAGDYDSLGDVAYCDTPITYANWKVADPFWNDFIYNATGIAAAQAAADGDGILKLGTRNVQYDVGNSAPPLAGGGLESYLTAYMSEQGVGFKPTLVVTYEPPPPPASVTNSNADIDSTTATLNGDITATGNGNCTGRGFVWDTATHADPGNVAPPATYANSWTEAGSFGTGVFDYNAEGLTELTTYYFRAFALNSVGAWTYSRELTFFIGEAGKVYLELRPDLDETKIRGQGGVPSDVQVGEFNGYSLPIWNSDNESLNYIICVPDRWDGESDILIRIDCATTDNESGNFYKWEILWEHLTPNEDVVPATSHIINYERTVYSELTYQTYQDWVVLNYDQHPTDPVVHDDLIGLTVRRVTTQKNDTGEIIVFAINILFARGDFLADPTGSIITIIEAWMEENMEEIGIQFEAFNVILAGWVVSLLLFLLAVAITVLAFWQKNVFLYLLAVPVNLVYGLSLAISADAVSSPQWVMGVVIAIIGMFCLFRVVVNELLPAIKRKMARDKG